MDWDYLQAPSPRESMHSILLMHVNRHEIELADRTANPHFELAAWLKLKNSAQLPSMLIIDYTDLGGKRWQIIDTARMHSMKGTILLSGTVDLKVRKLKGVDIYLCHPNPAIECEIEELRFNDKLIRRDFLDAYHVA